MFLISLTFLLVILPLLLTTDFTHLALLSAYVGLAHLFLLLVVGLIMWFGIRYSAIQRLWQRRKTRCIRTSTSFCTKSR